MEMELNNVDGNTFTETLNSTNHSLNIQESGLSKDTYKQVQHVCYKIILPILLGIGVLGNTANILILCQQRFQRSMDKMERCATMGFIFLACSDLLFCILGFPSPFVSPRLVADTNESLQVFELIYTLYRPGVLNVFLLSSTWCVVAIALERYIVVTYPMKARLSIRMQRTLVLQLLIPLASVVLNVPYLLRYKLEWINTGANSSYVYPSVRAFADNKQFRYSYTVTWNILGMYIPAVVLIFCNINLIRTINMTRSIGALNVEKYSTSKVTSVLIAIIVLHLALVCPSSILNMVKELYIDTNNTKSYTLLTLMVVFNVVQSSNFAVNFVLYFGINPKFRSYLRMWVTNCSNQSQQSSKYKMQFKQYESVSVL